MHCAKAAITAPGPFIFISLAALCRCGFFESREGAFEILISLQLKRLQNENVEAVVHWGNALEGAKILNQMRKMGMQQPYLTCDRCLSEEFVNLTGENAEGAGSEEKGKEEDVVDADFKVDDEKEKAEG